MRDPSGEERRILSLAVDMQRLEDNPAWQYVLEQIHGLKDGAMETVLGGLSPIRYRQKIGFIAALDDVLSIPGELYERNEQVKDSLNAE